MLSSWGNTLTQVILIGVIIVLLVIILLTPGEAKHRRRHKLNLTGTTKLEAQFFDDLRDKRSGRWSLADAFFIASGMRTESELAQARTWLDELVRDARQTLQPYRKVAERADHLLRWLHQSALSTYHTRSTSALEVIRAGRFNCLSSSLLYGMIGERLGLHIRGIIVDHHVFCRVYQKPQPKGRRSMSSRAGGWDVETTTPLGFNPGRSVQLDRAVVSVPRSRYRNRREVSVFEMIGLIYTNHIGLNHAYPNAEDRLLAYQKASLFFPRDPIIEHNVIAAHSQVIAAAIERQQWVKAQSFLEQLSELDQQGHESTQIWITLLDRHLNLIASKGLEEVLQMIDQYVTQSPQLPDATWSLLRARFHGRAAASLLAENHIERGMKHFKRALEYAKRGEAQLRRTPHKTRKLIDTLRHNSLIPVKNTIISMMNTQDIERVQQLLKLALRYVPQDRDLTQLKRKIRDAKRNVTRSRSATRKVSSTRVIRTRRQNRRYRR